MSSRPELVIAIDGYRLVAEPRTSGAAYVSEMVRALLLSPSVAKIYLLLCRQPVENSPHADLFAFEKVRLLLPPMPLAPEKSYIANVRWIQFEIPSLLRAHARDLTHYVAPYHQTPVRLPRSIRVTTIVHDFCGIRRDAGYSWRKRAFYLHHFNFFTARCRADALVPISEHTHSDIARFMSDATNRTTAPLYNPVTTPALDDSDVPGALAKWGLAPNSYFLAYGGGGIRKGTDLILGAYERYRRLGSAALVLIGSPGVGLRPEDLLDHELAKTVLTLRDLSDHDRDSLYRGAIALLFPSRCEGFGYPLVEAMRQGCPPIAWRNTPAAEIVRDAAPLLETLDIEGIVSLMWHHEARPAEQGTAFRKRLYERSLQFSDTGFGGRLLEILAT